MKNLKMSVLAILIGVISYAQTEFDKSLNGIDWIKIESKAKVIIKGIDGNEMKIVVSQPNKIPEKAKGLKLVGSGGTDNTGVGFYISEENGVLTVINLRNANRGRAEIFIPKNKNISISSNGLEDISIDGINGEIEATASVTGNVSITDVTGPVTISSNTGTVSVIFSKVNQGSPISISTATGVIDVSIPSSTPADISMHSTMGEIFSNFDLTVPDKDGLKAVSTRKVSRSINNGGVNIKLSSSTGNIFLRKI